MHVWALVALNHKNRHYTLPLLVAIEIHSKICRYFSDKIYAQAATNDELYRNEVQPIVDQVINGYHGTIFAYGQTSSGKTYTMLGTKQNPGKYTHASIAIHH